MIVRDEKSKKALIKYIKHCPHQRLFQCITNFVAEELGEDILSVYVATSDGYEDTFFWECDEKLED